MQSLNLHNHRKAFRCFVNLRRLTPQDIHAGMTDDGKTSFVLGADGKEYAIERTAPGVYALCKEDAEVCRVRVF